MPTPEFVVGRHAEVALFDDLLAGRTPYRLLEIYGPGGEPQLHVNLDDLCRTPSDPLGSHTLTVTAEDCGGNLGSQDADFELALQLEDGMVTVKPESLNSNDRRGSAAL